MMTELQAIEKRISCRAYRDEKIAQDILAALEAKINEINQTGNMHFILVNSDGDKTPYLQLASAMFAGKVHSYIILCGAEDPITAEKVGYFGEQIVLYATQLGLGTCWVGGTYDRASVTALIPEGGKIWDVIPLGYAAEKMPLKQKMIRTAIRAKDRKIEQFVESATSFMNLPEWFRKAIEAVRMGPSAVNQQPVHFTYDGGNITACLHKHLHGMEYNDMGIAKYHFEVAARANSINGTWEFGDGGRFLIK